MKLKLITVGKVKDKQISELIKDYSLKIGFDAKLETVEVKDSTVEEEGMKIIELIERMKNSRFVFVLSEEGKQLGSVEFSDKLKQLDLSGKTIVFVIGGPFGLYEELKKKADMLFSLSKMTFTHEMAHLFLMEQLYRSNSIIHNKKYHK
jgi:23S rRNA (pseudouridine1915-N3)-methyltransferase